MMRPQEAQKGREFSDAIDWNLRFRRRDLCSHVSRLEQEAVDQANEGRKPANQGEIYENTRDHK